MTNKICSKCKIEKPITEFYERHNFCKKCKLKQGKKWKLENREKYIEKSHLHENTEEGFLTRSISYLFCPSSIKDRGYIPESSKEEIKKYFYEYVKQYGRNCFYCKEPWTYLKTKVKMEKTAFKKIKRYPKNFSLDRLDNSKTYSVDNIIFCCAECNTSKNKISIKLIKRLYEIITERNL